MGGELVELAIHTAEMTYPVGRGLLRLTSVHVETAEQEAAADRNGPPKTDATAFGYRRAGKQYAYRALAALLGVAVCFPTVALLVWWILR